jgi:hypothetical protein
VGVACGCGCGVWAAATVVPGVCAQNLLKSAKKSLKISPPCNTHTHAHLRRSLSAFSRWLPPFHRRLGDRLHVFGCPDDYWLSEGMWAQLIREVAEHGVQVTLLSPWWSLSP